MRQLLIVLAGLATVVVVMTMLLTLLLLVLGLPVLAGGDLASEVKYLYQIAVTLLQVLFN